MESTRAILKEELNDAYEERLYDFTEFEKLILDTTSDNARVLDAGAGEGEHSEIFEEHSVEYIPVDSKVGPEDWDYSQVIESDIADMRFLDDESIDLVLLIHVLEHIPDPDEVLPELHRVMKNDGSLFLSVPMMSSLHQEPHDYYRYTPYGIKDVFNRNGFQLDWIAPQLDGDRKAGLRRLIWSLDKTSSNYIEMLLTSFIKSGLRFFKPFLAWLDKNETSIIHPVGYFARLRKQ